MEAIILLWLLCAVIGGAISNSKNRGWAEGLVLGGLLGIIGVIIALCLRSGAPSGMQAVACPRCNAQQNIPVNAPSFECWQCKYLARQGGRQEPGVTRTLRSLGLGTPRKGKRSDRRVGVEPSGAHQAVAASAYQGDQR